MSKHTRLYFSFSRKLFLSIVVVIWTFVAVFLVYQQDRERKFKVEFLNNQLRDFNYYFGVNLHLDDTDRDEIIEKYELGHDLKNLRVTVISSSGLVLYDNYEKDLSKMDNHLERKEVAAALVKGTGHVMRRTSETLGRDYYYFATYYSDRGYVVRSALPYDINLVKHLKADSGYLWFALLFTTVLTLLFFKLTNRLGTAITQLRTFAQKADHDEPFELDSIKNLSGNELGEISRHIIDIYQRLRKTRDDLFIEREKLIMHLQLSNEGLAIFKPDKNVILANSLFSQYGNLLSDSNLISPEEIFKIPELKPLMQFVAETLENYANSEEKRKAIKVEKNGCIFNIVAIVFQDDSFEISINDITKQEEQARIKRQITQNIAHELKTPVSSIQGYLETILNTEELSPDKLALFIERSYAQSNRLANLLGDISALTRMDEASGLIDREPLDVVTIVNVIRLELALQLEEKQMNVITHLPETMPLVGNSSLLYSIFRNLIDNAIAYAGESTTITLSCFRQDNEFYYLSVADNGVGVPDEHLSRIFERFYRIDKGRSRKMGGTGLGLAIVKNAVLFHGGNINAKRARGGGLEFVFSLRKK